MPPSRRLLVLTAACVAMLVSATTASANLFANGSFDSSTSGWSGWNANVSHVATGGIGGTGYVRVAVRSNARDYALSPVTMPVSSTVAGESFAATAWVRGAVAGRTVCLRVREWAGSTVAGSAQSCATTATSWRAFTQVTYKALAGGR